MITKFASARVLDVVAVPARANAKTLRKAAHRVGFKYEPRPGFIYVRSRAISSRCNDNYDEFPAEEIKKSYGSFIGKPVFVNHHNDNHRRARGVVIDAALHEDTNPDGTPDTWCEVLMEVDAVRFPKLAKAILAKHIDRTSMGTDVAFSVCSVCNNKATTPLEYCQHIPRMKGQRVFRATANGKKVGILVRELCYGLKFFENSLLVEEPADPTAFFLGVEAGPGVVGPKATKVASQDGSPPTRAKHMIDLAPPPYLQGDMVQYHSTPKPVESTMDEQIEREENSDLQLTPGSHYVRNWNYIKDPDIQSLNSIHAFFKQAELSPISKCKTCNAEKGTHCDIDCGGVRLYKQTSLDKVASDYPLECYGCGEYDHSGAKFLQSGSRKCPSCGSYEVHHPEAGENMKPKPPSDSEKRRETATHLVGLHLDNDYDSYHDVQSIVNNSKHPLETAHLVKQYVRGLPSDHPMHQDLRNHGVSHEDADYDQYAQDQHDERELNPGDIHPGNKDYERLLEARRQAALRKRAQGETIAPKDVDTLRDEECPVCAEKDSYDGDECQVCGFIQPPKMFQDPDLDMAKQVDLRKDNIDGFDPRDPNSDPQGAGQVPQQPGDDPNAVDAQGMPNEVPGSGVPGTDQVGIIPGGQPGQDPTQQPQVDPLTGMPVAPMSPQLLDQEGNPLPSQTGVPPTGLPYEGPEGSGQNSLSQVPLGPNGLPLSPGFDNQNDPSELGKTDVSIMGTEPGQPILDGTQPQVQMQFGTGESIENPEAPPGVQGDTMPTSDIYGQPLGPDGPIPPDQVQQMQNPLDPSQVGPGGEPLASDGAPGGGMGDSFAPDGQPFDTSQSADQSMMLACDFCGEEFESTPPTSITTDQQAGNQDGIMAGDVCPICGQGFLEPETQSPEQEGGNSDPVGGNPAGSGGDSLDNGAEKAPFGKNKLS